MAKPELKLGDLAVGRDAYYQLVCGEVISIKDGIARIAARGGDVHIKDCTLLGPASDVPEAEDIEERLEPHAAEHRQRLIKLAKDRAERAAKAAVAKSKADTGKAE